MHETSDLQLKFTFLRALEVPEWTPTAFKCPHLKMRDPVIHFHQRVVALCGMNKDRSLLLGLQQGMRLTEPVAWESTRPRRSLWSWSSWRGAQIGNRRTPLSWPRPSPPSRCQRQHASHRAWVKKSSILILLPWTVSVITHLLKDRDGISLCSNFTFLKLLTNYYLLLPPQGEKTKLYPWSSYVILC